MAFNELCHVIDQPRALVPVTPVERKAYKKFCLPRAAYAHAFQLLVPAPYDIEDGCIPFTYTQVPLDAFDNVCPLSAHGRLTPALS